MLTKLRTILVVLLVVLIVFVAAPAVAQPVLQLVWQRSCTGEVRVRGTTVECWQEVATPTTTPPPSATATPTPTLHPTVTVQPTVTPSVTPTPGPGVPMCAHNPRLWHDLYDEVQRCRYDHEHGEDPSLVNDIFGPAGNWFGSPGWEIGSPAAPADELGGGHRFWKTYVRRGLTAADSSLIGADGSYIKALRVQVHVATGGNGIKHRYHSYTAEIEACKPSSNRGKGKMARTELCGTFQSAGIFDYGNLTFPDHVTGGTIPFLLPLEPDGQDVVLPFGQRIHNNDLSSTFGTFAVWYPVTWGGPAGSANIQIVVDEGWSWTRPTAAGNDVDIVQVCDGNCTSNGSLRQLHVVDVYVPDWQPHNGTFVTGSHGNPDPACTALGQVGCGMQVLHNWPANDQLTYAVMGRFVEYDTSPPGQYWIRFPN